MVLTLCHFSSCHHSIVEANSTREHRRVLSLLCCSAGVEETGRLACPFCGKAPREAAASWESALTSFTPHLLPCAHHPKQSVGARSRRKIYGAGHLSMSLLFSPLFSEPCSLRCFTTFSKFPSCSSVWRICHDPVVHHQLQRKSPHKTFNHMISSSSQDIKVFLLPRLRETFKNTV